MQQKNSKDSAPVNTTQPAEKTNFKTRLRQRIAATKPTRWVRFAIVSLIFIAWVAWLGSWWVLIFLPLLFDIYITGFIPFTWWKKSKNKTVVMIMSWVDAIVYALILVYFVFTFIGQNYQIPSSSLERTLLTGDYLWVSKASYGPRVPMTPIHFPLTQNTLPVINTKSYLETPSWPYRRLKGISTIAEGDIVVFNFPAGDSIVVLNQNPDYHTLKRIIGNEVLSTNPALLDYYQSLPQYEADTYRNEIGKAQMLQHSEMFGELMYRPVDRRENYVKRCVGLPGDTLSIVDGQIYINGTRQPWPADAQFNYTFTLNRAMTDSDWEALGVANDDRHVVDYKRHIYSAPLTNAMVEEVKKMRGYVSIARESAPKGEYLFPEHISDDWTRADYGPLYIPKKGATVSLTPDTWPLYERIIRNYEGHSNSYVKDGKVYVDGREAKTYTFGMDYYFMMGDNRDNSLDSRYWGFVPEDHIVGKPIRVLISFDKDKSIFNGGIRWNRIFKNANTGFDAD